MVRAYAGELARLMFIGGCLGAFLATMHVWGDLIHSVVRF